jgi:hypothetical protein
MVNAPVEENVESKVAVNAPVTATVPVTFKAVPLQVKLAESDNRPDAPAKVTLVFVRPLFVTDVAVTEVNAPVVAVVAPTVPLMLIDAVPVRLVTVPLEGVPKASPLTTKAPAEPVLTPKAVTTPVPVVIEAGAAPAPPPINNAFAAKAADVAHVEELEK